MCGSALWAAQALPGAGASSSKVTHVAVAGAGSSQALDCRCRLLVMSCGPLHTEAMASPRESPQGEWERGMGERGREGERMLRLEGIVFL